MKGIYKKCIFYILYTEQNPKWNQGQILIKCVIYQKDIIEDVFTESVSITLLL